jgi:hypothetical protein
MKSAGKGEPYAWSLLPCGIGDESSGKSSQLLRGVEHEISAIVKEPVDLIGGAAVPSSCQIMDPTTGSFITCLGDAHARKSSQTDRVESDSDVAKKMERKGRRL